ncbi:MAG: tRNA (adenosine(37)-N6)-threonylcarbamoyltransferase complex ATPase subunit type 1 TsaE [bacterium]|nr:tRNA (adenosine(37)-N6)-threonylcarbamoyltransferase complex ATPase subunit type 1 TsaE [bacterium]
MEITSQDANETKEFGKDFGARLKGGEVLALSGDLGAGKTTFVQGLAEGLGITDRIMSPTFLLMREHKVKFGGKLFHIDLYRLEENVDREIGNLGVTDFWTKPENVVVIEWAEKAKNVLPPTTTWITFENISETERKITVK